MAAVAGQARGDHGAALWMQHWARALRPKGLLVQDYHVVAGHHDHAQGPGRSAHQSGQALSTGASSFREQVRSSTPRARTAGLWWA